MKFVRLLIWFGEQEQEVWLDGDLYSVVDGGRQRLRPRVPTVGPRQGGGRGVGGSRPRGGPQLPLHAPGGDTHESSSATVLAGRF